MKKILPVIFVLALLGVGGYYFVAGKKTAPADQAGQAGSGQPENNGVIGSIKEMMAGMQPIECIYNDKQGNQVTTMVKGENVRVSGKGNALIKGNTMYIWEEGAHEGMMMNFDKEAAEKAETGNKKKETIEDLEKYKDSCRRGSFSDSVFEVPTEVKFTDFAQSLMMPGSTTNNNKESSQTPNAEDVEKMMEQYKNMPGTGAQ